MVSLLVDSPAADAPQAAWFDEAFSLVDPRHPGYITLTDLATFLYRVWRFQAAQVEDRIRAVKQQQKQQRGEGGEDEGEDGDSIDWAGLEALLGDFNSKAAVTAAAAGSSKATARAGLPPRPRSAPATARPAGQNGSGRPGNNVQPEGVVFVDGRPERRFLFPPRTQSPSPSQLQTLGPRLAGKARPFGLAQQQRAAAEAAARLDMRLCRLEGERQLLRDAVARNFEADWVRHAEKMRQLTVPGPLTALLVPMGLEVDGGGGGAPDNGSGGGGDGSGSGSGSGRSPLIALRRESRGKRGSVRPRQAQRRKVSAAAPGPETFEDMAAFADAAVASAFPSASFVLNECSPAPAAVVADVRRRDARPPAVPPGAVARNLPLASTAMVVVAVRRVAVSGLTQRLRLMPFRAFVALRFGDAWAACTEAQWGVGGATRPLVFVPPASAAAGAAAFSFSLPLSALRGGLLRVAVMDQVTDDARACLVMGEGAECVHLTSSAKISNCGFVSTRASLPKSRCLLS